MNSLSIILSITLIMSTIMFCTYPEWTKKRKQKELLVSKINTAYFNKLSSIKQEVISTFPTPEDEFAYIEYAVHEALPYMYKIKLEDRRRNPWDPQNQRLLLFKDSMNNGNLHKKIIWSQMIPDIMKRLCSLGIKAKCDAHYIYIKLDDLELKPEILKNNSQGPYR